MNIQETLESVNKNATCILNRIRRMGNDACMCYEDESLKYQGFELCVSVAQDNTIRVALFALFSDGDRPTVSRFYSPSDLESFKNSWHEVFVIDDIRNVVAETMQLHSNRIADLAKFISR